MRLLLGEPTDSPYFLNMYDETLAAHYSAYRPPLHKIILDKALPRAGKRHAGLDIGCGTGYSALALANFCDYVIGVEPAKPMLHYAEKHDKVNYVNASGEQIPLAARSMDIVTLAGSLNYIELKSLIDELLRICRAGSEVVIYDFEVVLVDFEKYLGLGPGECSPDYDHSANLSGYVDVEEIAVVEEQLSLEASSLEIAQMLLSDSSRHNSLCEKYHTLSPLRSVESDIKAMDTTTDITINIFYSLYSLEESRGQTP